jgi:hypothetical protein
MPQSLKRFVQAGEPACETNPWTHNEWLCRPDLVPAEKLLMVRATMSHMRSRGHRSARA